MRTIQYYMDTAIQVQDVLRVDLAKSESRQKLKVAGPLITDPSPTSFTTLLKKERKKKYIRIYIC